MINYVKDNSICISIHALREESDSPSFVRSLSPNISIHALREESDRVKGMQGVQLPQTFQSTLSVRRATCFVLKLLPNCFNISIHALREESDIPVLLWFLLLVLFQSTLSVRRATAKKGQSMQTSIISIHALREESDFC